MNLIEFTNKGLYCSMADIYIDPWYAVDKALITHGHSDHARPGHKAYVCTHEALPVIKHRLGNIHITGVAYGEVLAINGVKFSFHPAGHVIGSAQIRVEYQGEVWVVSGDYKTENDHVSEKFEIVSCHSFITESTFGLPIYHWQPQTQIMSEINEWWSTNADRKVASIISAYSLGKAQRIINNVDHSIGPIFVSSTIFGVNEILNNQGKYIKPTQKISLGENYQNALVLCANFGSHTEMKKTFKDYVMAEASGWMTLRNKQNFNNIDKCFTLSDHADWSSLNSVIKETGAENIYVTHGYTDLFSKYLREQGYNAHVVSTDFNNDEESED